MVCSYSPVILRIFFRKYKYNSLQAPSILAETESNIDRSLGQFTKELGQMDTAVKKISDIAVDQANKYKNTMKKDYQVSHLLAVLWDFLH